MARKFKVGIDYFSHDTNMATDLKIKLLIAKHELTGYAIFLRLLEDLYSEKGYYLIISENYNILFASENKIEIDVYINIVNDCVANGLFNESLYKKYNILTSSRIQENYCAATERRKEVSFIKEYLLVDVKELYPERVNVCINRINVDKSTQSKEKKKESKAKKNNDKVKHLDFVLLTEEEHKKLIEKFGEVKTNEFIERLNLYIGSKGTNYKSHYFTILSWVRKDKTDIPVATVKPVTTAKPNKFHNFTSDGESDEKELALEKILLKNLGGKNGK